MQRYPSDLTDAEWARLEPLIPGPKPGGHPRTTDARKVIKGIFYVLREGISWRTLSKDFPPWQTVYDYFRQWRMDGTCEQLHEALHRTVRVAAGRDPEPSAGSLDSHSVKTTENMTRVMLRRLAKAGAS